MTVGESAGLHERTVQDAERHAAENARPRRGRGADKGERKVRTTTVDPRVMAEAKKLLDLRPGTKLRIVNAGEVVVE